MTPTEYTFRIEEDDQIRDVTVPLTFDDLPAEVTVRLALLPESEWVPELLAYRLSVPLEAARDAVDALTRGEGVVVS